MKGNSSYWTDFAAKCREELLSNVMPFWMKYGWDRKNGGVYTCLDRDGSLMDTTKSVWFQGRFGWMTAYAYRTVAASATGVVKVDSLARGCRGCRDSTGLEKQRREWLAASKSCCEFLEKHCFDRDGRAFFEVTAEGVGLRKRRYVFSECFAAMAYAEYALASGETAWARKAVSLFKRIRLFMSEPETYMPAKYTKELKTQGHSLTMILINVANVLKQVSNDPVLDRQITESVEALVKYFIHPEFKALLETVGPNGELIDTLAGRTINPGHCIETAWFLMDVAVARKDKSLLSTALQILDWSWAWGWDDSVLSPPSATALAGRAGRPQPAGSGGIISFRDCKGFPPQCYEQDMKFWWPQCEAIIATAYAYRLTGDRKYQKWHRLASTWAWKHLKDKKFPEWYGYLHRDGTVAQPAKGNIFKGPFHIPRMLVKSMEICEELK